jgi:hypothetical protein
LLTVVDPLKSRVKQHFLYEDHAFYFGLATIVTCHPRHPVQVLPPLLPVAFAPPGNIFFKSGQELYHFSIIKTEIR